MADELQALREHLAQITDLDGIASVLHWDQQTMMPPRGAPARADVMATLGRVRHELFVSSQTEHLLDGAAGVLDGADPDCDDARLVSVTRRRFEKASRVSSELAAELSSAASIGHQKWARARADGDFGAFTATLERNMGLARRYADCFEGYAHPYDALLDDYEPGMSSAELGAVFAQLAGELSELNALLAGREVDDSCVHVEAPVALQRALVADVVALMGFDRAGMRLDDTAHPFASSSNPDDVRITTRWNEQYFAASLYGAMHECGHGLFEAGIGRSLIRTPLARVDSLGVHESQSRLWENMVGRSRAFCELLAPRVAGLFGSMAQLDADRLFRAVNRVKPSFIRVEADEATYALHIILRFELEQALIDGSLAVPDVSEAWNARFAQLFGLQVPDARQGVLQDVHWGAGLIGYFPTYALGNLVAGQLWERLRSEIADLDAMVARGELSPLREWLREHVHRHGAKFTATELLARELSEPLRVAPFISYLKAKLSDVYEL